MAGKKGVSPGEDPHREVKATAGSENPSLSEEVSGAGQANGSVCATHIPPGGGQ